MFMKLREGNHQFYIYPLFALTPCQNPIEAPVEMNNSSITRSNICAKGRYDKYTSFSSNCKKYSKINQTKVLEGDVYIK